MPTAIRIVSGSRRGEEICLDAQEFCVGDTPQCEVYFDPRRDTAAKGRSARFRLQGDGWYMRPDSPDRLVLNHAPVEGETRIRSGDVVRMSESGPDFVFSVTSRPLEVPKEKSRSEADPRQSTADWDRPVERQPSHASPSPPRPPLAGRMTLAWRLAVACGLAVAVAAVAMFWLINRDDRAAVTGSRDADPAVKTDAVLEQSSSPTAHRYVATQSSDRPAVASARRCATTEHSPSWRGGREGNDRW